MNRATKYLGVVVVSAALLFTSTACGGQDTAAADTAAAEAELLTPGHVVEAVEGFFAAVTTAEVAAAFPDDADETTFSAAVDFTDPEAEGKFLATAMADLALVKVLDAKADLSITVDESRVAINDRRATIPAEAIAVTSAGKPVANSPALAEAVNDLVFRDGAWLITAPDSASASAPAVSGAPADAKK